MEPALLESLLRGNKFTNSTTFVYFRELSSNFGKSRRKVAEKLVRDCTARARKGSVYETDDASANGAPTTYGQIRENGAKCFGASWADTA